MIITNFSTKGKDICDMWVNNFKALQKQDKDARELKSLTGRYIQEPYADSHAYYVIVKENKKTVRIRVVSGIGDDWVLPYWGEETTIDRNYALSSIEFRDKMSDLIAKRR